MSSARFSSARARTLSGISSVSMTWLLIKGQLGRLCKENFDSPLDPFIVDGLHPDDVNDTGKVTFRSDRDLDGSGVHL